MESREDILRRAAAAGSVDGSSRLQALRARLGRRHAHEQEVTWPGGTERIRLRLLTVADREAATAAAQAAPEGERDGARAKTWAFTREILFRGVLATDGAPLFLSAAEVGELCSEDEMHALLELYMELRRSADPALSPEAVADVERMVADGDRRGLVDALDSLPRAVLVKLAERLIEQIPTPAEAAVG